MGIPAQENIWLFDIDMQIHTQGEIISVKMYMSYLELFGDIRWVPAEMNHCLQTVHFLFVKVSQGVSLMGQMGLMPLKKKKGEKYMWLGQV